MTATSENDPQKQATQQATQSDAPEGAAATSADPKAEAARLEAEKRELNDRLLRLAADFENFKRRARREMDEAGVRGMEGLLKELLPVLDNLDRAIDAGVAAEKSAADKGAAATALLDGVRLVQKQFLSALEKFQVKTFEALGKPFDPQFHEAVQQVESDTLEPGTVATVFQRGYTAGARLIRPAMVAVVRGRAQAPKAGDASEGEQPHQAELN